MESLSELAGFFSDREFAIPLWEVIVFIILISFCLLFGRNRLGLVTSYCFVFYWGFIFNSGNFSIMLGNTAWGMPLYVFSGFMMVIIVVTGFFIESKD